MGVARHRVIFVIVIVTCADSHEPNHGPWSSRSCDRRASRRKPIVPVDSQKSEFRVLPAWHFAAMLSGPVSGAETAARASHCWRTGDMKPRGSVTAC